ncbi:hypothetical protein [Bradyrhizobium sp. CCBAU 53338]|uniref:hypothetical protein n=1 Tax=Bradyrhizobium sp. CCBAU 53338 TaxID=1325111 RepID=UPI00188CDDA5|nr:hypothetical protein [Bradyrhizobium sp. CCBAU 53338]
MMIDCAALVTDPVVARPARNRAGFRLTEGQVRDAPVVEPKCAIREVLAINRHVDCTHAYECRLQGPQPSTPRKIVNQNQNTRQDMLQSNEIIGHGPRGQKFEVQNSTCVERQKEARICIGMQDGIPDDQRSR